MASGQTIQIDIDPLNHTCLDLKKKILTFQASHKEQCYQPNQQNLLFAGAILEDSRKLSDYNICQDSTIFLSIKPPPKDLLNFDCCNYCFCQAIDAVALPCGHSCCRTCVQIDAAACPVADCKTPLNGVPREKLPTNWVATHYLDPKPEKQTKACQVCEYNGAQKEATHWCETCSKTSEIQYYCEGCCATEHASLNTRKHVRVMVDAYASTLAFSTCPTHKISEDSYCFDDKKFICHMCCSADHKTHKTKLVVDFEKEVRTEVKASITGCLAMRVFQRKDDALQKSKKRKLEDMNQLHEKLKILKTEIEVVDAQMKDLHQESEKCLSASLVLMKSVEDYPIRDLFDAEKLTVMKTRVKDTVTMLSKGLRCGFYDSKILEGRDDLARLLEALFPNLESAELLYNASVHGWKASQFHEKCDGKDQTVVLAQVGTYVFGGYTHNAWSTTAGWVANNKETFLFSLCNPTNHRVGEKFNNLNPSYSLYCSTGYGPTFGGGHDFHIADQANINADSSYTERSCFNTPAGNKYFCGAQNFQPTNVEVFALKFN